MNYTKQKYGVSQNFDAMGSGPEYYKAEGLGSSDQFLTPEILDAEAGGDIMAMKGGAAASGGGGEAAAGANPYVGAAMVGASFLSNYMKNLRDREDAAQRAQAEAAQNRFSNESKGLDSMNNVFARSLLR